MRTLEDFTLYNSWDTSFKSSFGSVKTHQKVDFCVHLPKRISPKNIFLLIFPFDREEEQEKISMSLTLGDIVVNHYSCSYESPTPQLLSYYFQIETEESTFFIKKGKTSASVLEKGVPWQLTVYSEDMKTPPVFGEGIIYQIFPDRFYNSGIPKNGVAEDRHLREDWGSLPDWRPDGYGIVKNNDYFQGDLLGVEKKLDYLQALGVTLIYLNPIFEAHTSHRYDTADYRKIDPLLGTEEDFEKLCKSAKEKGIHIILDGVFNHTGSDSVYFNRNKRYGDSGAYNDPTSPYYPWYYFRNYPNEYESWWGFSTLPNVNEENQGYQEFICGTHGVLAKWMNLGAAGYRLDVADELPDSFLDALHHRVKTTNPEAAIVGEVWEDASNKISYGVRRRYLLGGQLDSVMNYPFKDAILSYIRSGGGEELYHTILTVLENYPPPVIACLMNSLSTHDTPRAITLLVGEELGNHDREWQSQHHYLSELQYAHGKKLLTLAMVLQFGLPGIPCVYYGDEVGLSGYRDPFNRVCYPWDYQDTQLLDMVTELAQMRKNHPWMASCSFVPLIFGEKICTFLRGNGNESIFFAINRGNTGEPIGYSIPKDAKCIFTSQGGDRETLPPYSAWIFYWKTEKE